MNIVASNIKRLRKKKGISQNDLADKLGVTRQTVSNWKNGKAYPDIEMLMVIAQNLNTDINELVYGPKEIRRNNYNAPYKMIFAAMLVFWLLLIYGAVLIGIPIFSFLLGEGIEKENTYAILFAIMLLAGLIVLCTCIVLEKIHELKNAEESEDETREKEN